jgi:hypothetical protein
VRNYPGYREWQDKFAKKNVTTLGVHTPETEGEKKLDRIKEKMKESKLTFPLSTGGVGVRWSCIARRSRASGGKRTRVRGPPG